MEFVDLSQSTAKNLSSHWKGYKISKTKPDGARRFTAQCPYCNKEFRGEGNLLNKHKFEDCPKKNSWPEELMCEAEQPPAAVEKSGQLKITNFTKVTPVVTQNVVDTLFFKSLVNSSVPFAYANDYFLRELFGR